MFADTIGIQHAYFLPVVCYLCIAYYECRGMFTHLKDDGVTCKAEFLNAFASFTPDAKL